MRLHFEGQGAQPGYNVLASPANSPLRWQTFGTLVLPEANQVFEENLADEELVLTLLSGKGFVEIEERSGRAVRYEMGPRTDPFTERATLAYVPPGARYRVTSVSAGLHCTVHRAPAKGEGAAFLVRPDTLVPTSTGAHHWRRDVCLCIPPALPAQRFIIGETVNPPGNWSSYPPHKHDVDAPPQEAIYEEVYYFLFKPSQGFGFIRLYDPLQRESRMDQALVLKHGDTVVIPRGYHPVAAAPGYQLYYLFSLVGQAREYAAWSDDPDHAWVHSAEVHE